MSAREGTPEQNAGPDRLLAFRDTVPAILYDRRLQVLDATPLARALSPAFAPGVNLARFAFLSPERNAEHPRWREMSAVVAGLLRDSLDQHDEDRASQRIVGELSAKSREFSEIWAAPEMLPRTSGYIEFEGTAVGTVRTDYTVLNVPDYEDNALMVFVPVDEEARIAVARLSSSDGRAAR